MNLALASSTRLPDLTSLTRLSHWLPAKRRPVRRDPTNCRVEAAQSGSKTLIRILHHGDPYIIQTKTWRCSATNTCCLRPTRCQDKCWIESILAGPLNGRQSPAHLFQPSAVACWRRELMKSYELATMRLPLALLSWLTWSSGSALRIWQPEHADQCSKQCHGPPSPSRTSPFYWLKDGDAILRSTATSSYISYL